MFKIKEFSKLKIIIYSAIFLTLANGYILCKLIGENFSHYGASQGLWFSILLTIAFFVFTSVVVSILSFQKHLLKIWLTCIFLASPILIYFSNEYGVYIDKYIVYTFF